MLHKRECVLILFMTYSVMEMLLWMTCIIIVVYRTKYTQRKTKWFMGSNGINVQMDINHCDYRFKFSLGGIIYPKFRFYSFKVIWVKGLMVGCNRGNIRIRNKYCVLHDSWTHLDHCEMKIVSRSIKKWTPSY